MNSHSPARPLSPARGDAALSRRTLLGRAALGAAGAAWLGPRLAYATQATPTAGVPDLVAGNTAFALDLYAAVRQDEDLISADGNLLFSPYSVSQALAMTYAGARGETATQMAETLGFRLSQPALHAVFANLNADLVASGNAEGSQDESEPPRALRLANALWGERTYPFDSVYTGELARYYGAGLQKVDFLGAPEDARQDINAWVAEQTEDRIRDIVPPGAIDAATRLVLANAIWFYGSWASPFYPSATEGDDFFLKDGATATVPFMVQHDFLPYAGGDGYQAIEFPYQGSGFTFTVILPDEGQFATVEAGLDAGTLSAAIGQLTDTDVRVYLPKFEFEFGASLAQTLQAMGMTDAFDAARADFTGMVEGTPPEPLSIGEVLHKAFIGVDEKGTEAAAATVVEIAAGAAPDQPTPPPPIEVRIDRPFLFAIRDSRTGTVLFLGRVMDPSA